MKISFLVTYYNQEQYVRQSLDSILAIEKPDEWEILIGDDGSSDGTVGIVREYTERDSEHIRLYVMSRDAKIKYDPVERASANRLNLLEHCSGDCFCTLDGDDFFIDSSFVKEAIEVLEKKKEISVVAFGFSYYTDQVLSKAELLPAGSDQQIDKTKYLANWYLPAGSCVHRKKWGNDRIEYIRKLYWFDDNDIMVNSLNYGDMYFIGKSVYAYRQTDNSTFNSMKQQEKDLLNSYTYDINRCMIGTEYHQALLDRYGISLLNLYIWRKKMDEMVGLEKRKRMMNYCSEIPDSLCYQILEGKLSEKHKKIMRGIKKKNPGLTLRLYANYWVRSVLGIEKRSKQKDEIS